MKRALCVLLALSMLVLLVGCGGNTDVSYAKLIPDPEVYFEGSDISVIDADGGSMYLLQIQNYQDGEYESYVAECKKMGFNDVSYEMNLDTGKSFGAYSEDENYWVSVAIAYDIETITITCKTATEIE